MLMALFLNSLMICNHAINGSLTMPPDFIVRKETNDG